MKFAVEEPELNFHFTGDSYILFCIVLGIKKIFLYMSTYSKVILMISCSISLNRPPNLRMIKLFSGGETMLIHTYFL